MSRLRRFVLRLCLLVGVPLIVAAVGLVVWLHGGRFVNTENAYVKADIAQVAPEVAGRVIEVAVRNYMPVTAGQTLFRLDPEPYRLALERAEAELDGARAQVETLRASWRETKSELADAENRAGYYSRQWNRQRELAERGVASHTARDASENDFNAARDKINVTRARLQRVLTALNNDPNLPIEEHPLVREKRAARDRAALELARTKITAPVNGTAVNVTLQLGDQVKVSTPLFVVVAETRPWVEANFKETELTNVLVGQRASVVLDIYPDVTWEARVESISPAAGSEFAILPPQNASGNWVKVVQRLPVKLRLMPHESEPPLRAGMTATVNIDTGRERKFDDIVAAITKLAQGSAAAANKQ